MLTSLDKWKAITQGPAVIEFFRGLFQRAGIRVTDTHEQFTCVHLGDRIGFEPSLDPAHVDYTVEVRSEQIDRLSDRASSGTFDTAEQFRIVSALFTPATAAALRHPVLSNPVLWFLAGAESLIHVVLLSPDGGESATGHTLVYANRQWLVLSGLVGRARRTFRLTPADALVYHRKAFEALRANSWGSWIRFSVWYRRWRPAVSIRSRVP
jgi:hypothetical protein